MEKYKTVRIVVSILGVVVVIFGISISIAVDRIGHYSVLTPLENLTFTERIAAKLNNSSFRSRDELKKDGLLESNETIKKDNIENLNKANEKKETAESNYSKSELEFMYVNSEKYIGKTLEFTGTISADVGMNQSQKDSIVKTMGEKDAEEFIKILDESDYDVILAKINNTNVSVVLMCNKNKIDYDNWKKGTLIKANGTIDTVEKDINDAKITLSNNPNITVFK